MATRTKTAMPQRPDLRREVAEPKIVTPLEMLNQALLRGDPDTIGRMMDFAERWQKADARREFEVAMAAAKANIKPVIGSGKVDYKNKDGKDTKFTYETMEDIDLAVTPILAKHGLSFRYRSEQREESLKVICIISHKDGHFEEVSLEATKDKSGGKNDIQALASTVTYLQRYTLKLALGLSVDKKGDDDGKAAGLGARISEEQVGKLRQLLEATRTDEQRFVNYLKSKYPETPVEKLEDLMAFRFDSVMLALESKRKAMGGKAQ